MRYLIESVTRQPDSAFVARQLEHRKYEVEIVDEITVSSDETLPGTVGPFRLVPEAD